jgi:hypothetical protein
VIVAWRNRIDDARLPLVRAYLCVDGGAKRAEGCISTSKKPWIVDQCHHAFMSYWNVLCGLALPESPASRHKKSASIEVANSGKVSLEPVDDQRPHGSPRETSLSRSNGALKINQGLLRYLEETSRPIERCDHSDHQGEGKREDQH